MAHHHIVSNCQRIIDRIQKVFIIATIWKTFVFQHLQSMKSVSESGQIPVSNGWRQKPLLDGSYLSALMRHCMRSIHVTMINIATLAKEYRGKPIFQKLHQNPRRKSYINYVHKCLMDRKTVGTSSVVHISAAFGKYWCPGFMNQRWERPSRLIHKRCKSQSLWWNWSPSVSM